MREDVRAVRVPPNIIPSSRGAISSGSVASELAQPKWLSRARSGYLIGGPLCTGQVDGPTNDPALVRILATLERKLILRIIAACFDEALRYVSILIRALQTRLVLLLSRSRLNF